MMERYIYDPFGMEGNAICSRIVRLQMAVALSFCAASPIMFERRMCLVGLLTIKAGRDCVKGREKTISLIAKGIL